LRNLNDVRTGLHNNSFHQELSRVYGADAPRAAGRFLALLDGFCDFYGVKKNVPVALFSTPGRTEIGGNHTDHQKGHALASSVNLDTIACVSPTDTGVIRIKSAGHRLAEVTLDRLEMQEEEWGTSPSLVRGIVARITELGYRVGGFDAYTMTEVLRGSGLSSSATFEVLVGNIINHLYCNGELTSTQIAQIGQYAENVYYGKPCGLMDQLACATGGVIALDFAKPFPEIQQVQFDLYAAGYAMCIVDSRVSHADLSADFAAIPEEMCAVARYLDKSCLGEVEEKDFYANLTALRKACGDRAVLRAMHFFKDDQYAQQECAAIAAGDMKTFLELIRRSGRSSYMYLQNVSTYRSTTDLGLAVLLAFAEQLVGDRGACRVHGGGFAGTIQAFVPLDMLEEFIEKMEQLTGKGSCFVLSFRPIGTCCVLK